VTGERTDPQPEHEIRLTAREVATLEMLIEGELRRGWSADVLDVFAAILRKLDDSLPVAGVGRFATEGA